MRAFLLLLLIEYMIVGSANEFTAHLDCTPAGYDHMGNAAWTTDGYDMSIATCPDGYTLIDCMYWSRGALVPGGTKIVSDICMGRFVEADSGYSTNGQTFMRTYAHCCKFEEQTLPSGAVFSASLDCNQYESKSTSEVGAMAVSQCQSDDEYLFGCNGYSDEPNLRGFCPGDEECADIKYGMLAGGRYENVDENHVDGGGRFLGFTNFANAGEDGKCTAIKGSRFETSEGVSSQANCCKIEGYNTDRFELKEVQCQIAFEAFGNFGDYAISCADSEYQTVGITASGVSDDILVGSVRTAFTGGYDVHDHDDNDIFADWVSFTGEANGIEAYGICCKVIFEEK